MSGKDYMKTRMRNGEVQFGAFVMVPSPSAVEMFGYAGFDFVIIDREHGAGSLETLENSLRAAEASGMEALVRIPNGSASEILSALDAGASGIVVPHVTTAEQAAAIVNFAHYPPYGSRGFATTSRAGRHGFVTVDEHLERARERTLVLAQIEDADALPNVRAIANVEGLDGAFIGPADLAMSLGAKADFNHPKTVAAIDSILDDLSAVNKTMGAAFAADRDAANMLVARGVRMICLSGTAMLTAGIRQTAKEIIVR